MISANSACTCHQGIGHNALFFTQRYSCTVQDIIEGRVNRIVGYHCNAVSDDYCLDVANCLYELNMVRDNVFIFSDNFHVSSCDLIDIIANLHMLDLKLVHFRLNCNVIYFSILCFVALCLLLHKLCKFYNK